VVSVGFDDVHVENVLELLNLGAGDEFGVGQGREGEMRGDWVENEKRATDFGEHEA